MSDLPATALNELQELGLQLVRTIANTGGNHALLCRTTTTEEKYRVWQIAIAIDGSIREVIPAKPCCPPILPFTSVLWGGTRLLIGLQDSPDVICFDMERGVRESNLLDDWRDEVPLDTDPPHFITGTDVDPSGRYALVAFQWDDFPNIIIFDRQGESFALNAQDLIDLDVYRVRWFQGTEEICCELSDGWVATPVDLANRVAYWRPRSILPPCDAVFPSHRLALQAPIDPGHDDDSDDDEAISSALYDRYRRAGYSDSQIGLLIIAVSTMKKLTRFQRILIHRLFLMPVWPFRVTAITLFSVGLVLGLLGRLNTLAWAAILVGFVCSFIGRWLRGIHRNRDRILRGPDATDDGIGSQSPQAPGK